MKTLLYNISWVRDKTTFNSGFVILKINDENELESVEGVATLDYFKSVKLATNKLSIEYYAMDEEISLYDLKLEIVLQADLANKILNFSIDEDIEIDIKVSQIKEDKQKNSCLRELRKVKRMFSESV